jgi:hypothetical protein
MSNMNDIYEVGQYVYTAKDIRGWFDYTLSDVIPVNTMGKIVGYYAMRYDIDSVVYRVEFENEFGTCNVIHSCLKLEEDE